MTIKLYTYPYLHNVGSLTGFVDIGSISNHLSKFQHQIEQRSCSYQPPLAKSMLVVMVRGLFSGLQFPYVQFPCCALRSYQMFDILWKTVGRLERYGFKVMGLTCDGLPANRQLFRLHAPRQATDAVYKTKNPFAIDGRDFYFFSDPPHLIKTIRNCFASRSRHLWVSCTHVCTIIIHM